MARVLREAGFAVRDQDVCGHFASNLSCWPEVNAETRQRIAYALDPEAAMSCERDAEEIIARMTDAERDLYEKDLLDWAR
ncbi:MAG: hypothetical protein FJZ90_03050 [Chloroflexi bacterium]|nr:hypothetical protein [Chloroflexota bacterium]